MSVPIIGEPEWLFGLKRELDLAEGRLAGALAEGLYGEDPDYRVWALRKTILGDDAGESPLPSFSGLAAWLPPSADSAAKLSLSREMIEKNMIDAFEFLKAEEERERG